MKKVLLFSILFILNLGWSQTKLDKNDAILKGVKIENLQDPKFDLINNAKISWDFSGIDLAKKNVSIEVITIYDCFNGENASDFKETISVLSKENFVKNGSRELIHVELMAKCFKWRLVLVENNQTKVSDWSYFSFLK